MWTDNGLWLNVIAQVAVVGGSSGWDRLNADRRLRASVSWKGLGRLTPDQRRKRIHKVFRAASVRYAAKNITDCRKSAALAHNYKVLKNSGGPKAFFARLAAINGPNAVKRRVRYLMRALMFFKSKSARENLMELGLAEDAIAFDIRLRNVFRQVGIELPLGFESAPDRYDEVERQVRAAVCEPLGLTGVQFDRLLYQNYSKIIRGGTRES